jgi:hypothetical protein
MSSPKIKDTKVIAKEFDLNQRSLRGTQKLDTNPQTLKPASTEQELDSEVAAITALQSRKDTEALSKA